MFLFQCELSIILCSEKCSVSDCTHASPVSKRSCFIPQTFFSDWPTHCIIIAYKPKYTGRQAQVSKVISSIRTLRLAWLQHKKRYKVEMSSGSVFKWVLRVEEMWDAHGIHMESKIFHSWGSEGLLRYPSVYPPPPHNNNKIPPHHQNRSGEMTMSVFREKGVSVPFVNEQSKMFLLIARQASGRDSPVSLQESLLA